MADQPEKYFVFMKFDSEYEHLRADRSKKGMAQIDAYLSTKHDQLLAKLLQPNTYKKRTSLAIVDGFSVEITGEQVASYITYCDVFMSPLMHCTFFGMLFKLRAEILRLADEVRVVEKNQELA